MDDNVVLKLSPFNQKVKNIAPYGIAIIGCFVFVVVWAFCVPKQYLLAHAFYAALPWIILVAGIASCLLAAVAVHLVRVMHGRSAAFSRMDLEFKKEIVERINAEETKKNLEIALLQGQKLQAIGTLAGGIAHDFNNILYAIIGYVEMAREDVSPDGLLYKNLGKVLEAALRGQELVARILAFGRRHIQPKLEEVHLHLIIENVLSLLKPTIPASVLIEFLGTADEYVILGNQTQLHQVFVNIINNAVDAMDGEGQVTITVAHLPADSPYLKQFPDLSPTNYYKIDISDTGHGMDKTTMERIFDPFFTTKEVGKGTGLGLSTVHAIMKEHRGKITVSSQLGSGTTFTLLLPEHQPQQEDNDGNHYVSRR